MKVDINYKFLIVNPENYRFDSVDTQEQAIDLMLEKKGTEIFNLAKHILENGLDKAKDFRVLKKDEEHYLVLDGNRRVTAVKCLHDTSIIKDDVLRLKFNKLQIDKAKVPQKIQSFIYDSEKEAAEWIKLDHTGKNNGIGQNSWGSAEKDRFGYKFEGKISPAMQAVAEVEREMGIKFDTKKLKVSTINRIFSNPESRLYTGIDISNKKIIFIAENKEVINRLNKLFRKVIDDEVTVAQVYTTKKTVEFMKQLFGDKPKLKNEQPLLLDIDNIKNNGDSNINEKNKTLIYEDNELYVDDHGKNGEMLINSKKVPATKSKKIKETYKELTIISVKKCPTAVFALVRVLIDITVKEFLIKKGYEFDSNGYLIIKSEENNKHTLKEKMDYIANNYLNGDLKNSIVALNEDLLTQNLNQVMHSTIFSATETKIRDFWKNLQPILEFLWQDIIDLESKK